MATVFPPQPYDIAFKQIAVYDAWYANDMNAIPEAAGNPTHIHSGMPHTGGLQGMVSSGLFGTPVAAGQNRSAMGIPVAGDLAQLSADLLFGEACKITLPDSRGKKAKTERKDAQARLELIVSSDAAHAELLRAGEYAAAHGSAYLGIVWDASFREHVWFRAYRADCVIPEWRYGELWAATCWTDYVKDDDTYRLFERHTRGYITYSLWKGTAKERGSQVALSTIAETEHYLTLRDAGEVDQAIPEAATLDVAVKTGVPYLTVEYFPNMMPNPMWDKKGELANLGRSDFFGLEQLFVRINAIWSSLMLDFDNGMGRLTVPESYLKLQGRGKGAAFEYGRSVYSPVGGLVDDGKGGQITISQFKIRVTEHLQAIEALKREIAQAAGYSISHFGIHDKGTKTATEVNDDRTDSERTRDKKGLYVRPALARLSRTALAIDGLVFPGKGGGLITELPDVDFVPISQVDPLKRAQTTSAEMIARVRSIASGVRAVQPDLDEDEIDIEVARIREENGMGLELDPAKFTDEPPVDPEPEPVDDAELEPVA